MKLNMKAFALTCSVLWGVGLFFATWWIIIFEGPSREQTILGRFYRGYRFTPLGSIVGLFWGMLDGFIGGALFAWAYNQAIEALGGQAIPKEHRKYRDHDHLPWLYAIAHRVPGIHA